MQKRLVARDVRMHPLRAALELVQRGMWTSPLAPDSSLDFN